MSSFNRIAIYGHRGWASSKITEALIASGAPIRVIYRPGSDISSLPASVTSVEVDVNDEKALVDALHDIDVVISLVGHEGVERQHAFIKAIPKTEVKLFSPSELAGQYDEQGLKIGVNKAKRQVEEVSIAAGIPTSLVLLGNFAEFALNTPGMGVDLPGNRIVYSGNSAKEVVDLCTRNYVAAAYAAIFASTPIAQIQNRSISISELKVTGEQVATTLEKKHGAPPRLSSLSLERVNSEVEAGLNSGSLFTLAWYCRKIWGTGQQAKMVGTDIWEVQGYEKATLEDLIVDGKLGAYRQLPPQVAEYFHGTF
ncbi:uncharacterized protein CCOS01_12370 [Colletotrichum costaricense]|uniref:NmrA-like domain-containing protein n=2 Tax=Colletotrichum acutatum species complex TaxID=2707335 RepID=A0AAI9YMI7_9PEZI|nr:uncharacterized protein CCOS01_12370 [Colletotrichum costaricense]XP_060377731.1 uncharacterized protein CTAM01_11679 [Colletotrichum tamarilloi]KAK1487833.1 hypothetical protein CTAM01_11679 [Colletotrichum tamarilloi]KAK1516821.1 hypothetical protein CCOS01_12370 [Colletotrichum costaricense]